MKKNLVARLASLAAMLVATGVPSAAFADVVVLKGFKYSGAVEAEISQVGRTIGSMATPGPRPGKSLEVYADEFIGTNNGQSFSAYCADIFKYDVMNAATNYSVGDLNATFGFTKANDLFRLVNQRYSSVNNASSAAAFQMATWEILFESSGNPYKLSSNTFKALTDDDEDYGSSSAFALAQSWLDGLATTRRTGNYDVNYLQVASGNQSLVFFTPSAAFITSSIPEPETYALMLAGLGLVAFSSRRKKKGVI